MLAAPRKNAAQTHGGHAVDFGKRPADEQIRRALDERQSRDAAEFVVRFVDQHDGFAGSLEDALDALEMHAGPGGVVGIGQNHGARLAG